MEHLFEHIPFNTILEKAEHYKKDICQFTRDLVKITSFSGSEGDAIQRVKQEMEKLEYDKITIDPLGNVLGYIGTGKHLVAMDGHLDVVGYGDLDQWQHHPTEGYEDEEKIIGRGTTDMKGAVASIVYAARIIKELDLTDDFTFLVTGTVCEETCEGLSWKYIIEELGIRPDFVLLAEPSDDKIARAQKGRMELSITTKGLSAHASIPHEGDNAIYKMASIVQELEELNDRLHVDDLLGKGCLTVSEINSSSAGRCSVADGCTITIDRRLTWGETSEKALQEIRDLPSVKQAQAIVEIYNYDIPSYTGLEYYQECSFKPWKIEEDHVVTQSVAQAYKKLFKKDPVIDVWPFSTNGVSIMGLHNIPVIGFGPGQIKQAHVPDEAVLKSDLVACTALYAALPFVYVKLVK